MRALAEAVAGAVDRRDPGQHQILDVQTGGESHQALHFVGSAKRARLDRLVAGAVDDRGVVAIAAGHRVVAGAAIEEVGAEPEGCLLPAP